MIPAITSHLRSPLALAAVLGLLILVPVQGYSWQAPTSRDATNETKIPDFNGVWRTINAPDAPREGTTLRWVPRPGELPSFTPEYAAKYKQIQVSRESGSEETEPVARCLPPGMPWFMLAQYGLEIVQSRSKIALFSEWMDAYRRIYL